MTDAICTNRGRAAVYRRQWGWPLRSPRHLMGTQAPVDGLADGGAGHRPDVRGQQVLQRPARDAGLAEQAPRRRRTGRRAVERSSGPDRCHKWEPMAAMLVQNVRQVGVEMLNLAAWLAQRSVHEKPKELRKGVWIDEAFFLSEVLTAAGRPVRPSAAGRAGVHVGAAAQRQRRQPSHHRRQEEHLGRSTGRCPRGTRLADLDEDRLTEAGYLVEMDADGEMVYRERSGRKVEDPDNTSVLMPSRYRRHPTPVPGFPAATPRCRSQWAAPRSTPLLPATRYARSEFGEFTDQQAKPEMTEESQDFGATRQPTEIQYRYKR